MAPELTEFQADLIRFCGAMEEFYSKSEAIRNELSRPQGGAFLAGLLGLLAGQPLVAMSALDNAVGSEAKADSVRSSLYASFKTSSRLFHVQTAKIESQLAERLNWDQAMLIPRVETQMALAGNWLSDRESVPANLAALWLCRAMVQAASQDAERETSALLKRLAKAGLELNRDLIIEVLFDELRRLTGPEEMGDMLLRREAVKTVDEGLHEPERCDLIMRLLMRLLVAKIHESTKGSDFKLSGADRELLGSYLRRHHGESSELTEFSQALSGGRWQAPKQLVFCAKALVENWPTWAKGSREIMIPLYLLVRSSLRANDLSGASKYCSRMLHTVPDSPLARYASAWISYRLGQTAAALSTVSGLCGEFPQAPWPFYMKAQLLSQTGRISESAEAVRTALRKGRVNFQMVAADPMLAKLRESPEWKKDMASVKYRWWIDIGIWNDDVVLKNESFLPLTNVRFRVTVRSGLRTWAQSLMADKIDDGAEHTWGDVFSIPDGRFDAAQGELRCDQLKSAQIRAPDKGH